MLGQHRRSAIVWPDMCPDRDRAPAASIPSKFWIVPKFTRSAPAALLRSDISSGAVAMMGDAPSASVALADWVVTTLFVIWEDGAGRQCGRTGGVEAALRSRVPDGPMASGYGLRRAVRLRLS